MVCLVLLMDMEGSSDHPAVGGLDRPEVSDDGVVILIPDAATEKEKL